MCRMLAKCVGSRRREWRSPYCLFTTYSVGLDNYKWLQLFPSYTHATRFDRPLTVEDQGLDPVELRIGRTRYGQIGLTGDRRRCLSLSALVVFALFALFAFVFSVALGRVHRRGFPDHPWAIAENLPGPICHYWPQESPECNRAIAQVHVQVHVSFPNQWIAPAGTGCLRQSEESVKAFVSQTEQLQQAEEMPAMDEKCNELALKNEPLELQLADSTAR